MDLEFDELQLDLRDTARTVLAGACPPSFVRAVYEASGEDAAGDVAALWSTFCELDWPGLGLPESVGGLGLGVGPGSHRLSCGGGHAAGDAGRWS